MPTRDFASLDNLFESIFSPMLLGIDLARYEKPEVKNIIFNNPATIVYWTDGTKTVVKTMEGDTYDEVYGVAMCYTKKLFGSNSKFKQMVEKFKK